jgi:hypothetical protein
LRFLNLLKLPRLVYFPLDIARVTGAGEPSNQALAMTCAVQRYKVAR